METLREHIDPSILPACLGGLVDDASCFDMEFIHQIITDNVATDGSYENYVSENWFSRPSSCKHLLFLVRFLEES